MSEYVLTGILDEAGEDWADQLGTAETLGWQQIELRNIGGLAVSDLPNATFGAIAADLRSSGMSVVCIDSRIGNWSRRITASFDKDLEELAILADRAADVGCSFVRVMSFPNDGLPETEWREKVLDRMARLTAIAERANIVLLHENCAGWAGQDPAKAVDMVESIASRHLRLLFDAGNGRAYGYAEIDYLRATLAYVEHVHVKDAIGTGTDVRYVDPGEGECRLGDSITALLGAGYRGAFAIEPHKTTRPHEGRTVGDRHEFQLYARDFERFFAQTLDTTTSPGAR